MAGLLLVYILFFSLLKWNAFLNVWSGVHFRSLIPGLALPVKTWLSDLLEL